MRITYTYSFCVLTITLAITTGFSQIQQEFLLLYCPLHELLHSFHPILPEEAAVREE